MNKDIAEIYILLGRIQEQIKHIEKHIDNIEWVKQKREEDYYNDVCIDSQYGTVSKYNPIRSLDNPPPECLAAWDSIRDDLYIPSTQACDVKENH